ncbi:MAG: hypothetical protein HQL80_12995 [Magnetococcales bacterium]|nr:hypothetical protein [Magnetococcales bacterium]
MAEVNDEWVTASGIAKALGISDTKVKKAIQELGLEPSVKKGVCSYYARDAVDKVKGKLLP